MALTLQQRILFTLAYTLQFEYPLTVGELYLRLVGTARVSQDLFVITLKRMIETGEVIFHSGYLFLGSFSENEVKTYFTIRKKRSAFSQKKWAESNIFINLVKRIPFISGVAVTGSVAMNNAVKDDDVDFLIVTQQNRLWITRLLLVGLASFLGKRRSFAQEEKNSWCFNLWIETTDIKLPRKNRSIYEAYEVVQTQWVYSKKQIDKLFFISNSWVKNFLPHSKTYYLNSTLETTSAWKNISIFSILFYIVDLLLDACNYVCFLVQYWYMKRHMTREKVSLTHAFFHPRDTKKQVMQNVINLLKAQKAI